MLGLLALHLGLEVSEPALTQVQCVALLLLAAAELKKLLRGFGPDLLLALLYAVSGCFTSLKHAFSCLDHLVAGRFI